MARREPRTISSRGSELGQRSDAAERDVLDVADHGEVKWSGHGEVYHAPAHLNCKVIQRLVSTPRPDARALS